MNEAPSAGQPPQGDTVNPAEPPSIRKSILARIRRHFLAGILMTAPVAVTLYLASLLISFFDARITPLIPPRFNPESYLPFAIPGLGLAIVVLVLILIGSFAAGYTGRAVSRAIDVSVTRMPVLRSIYGAVKQIVEAVLAQKSQAFRQAVLVEYPRKGIWAIGFVTGVTQGEPQRLTEEETLNVFLPTTPNPTSGFLLFVPRSDVRPLSMSVEDALKLVISGGLVTPVDTLRNGADSAEARNLGSAR